MSTHFSTTVQINRLSLPSTSNSDEDSVVSTASSVSDSDLGDDDISLSGKTSATVAATNHADIEANAKPASPSAVNRIVNALSVVGTFGGLGLIITGGMGMTLNKPVDNTMENITMVLGGSALLVGSWVGNIVHANHQATQT
jgi:hypothetical protein